MTYDNVADHFVSHKMKLATTAGQFRLTIRLKVKEGRKLVEGILNPGDPISLKFSTSDKTIRLVMSQSKIENGDLEFFASFEIRCDGYEKIFDLERVTNHLTIKPINCPRIHSKVGIKLYVVGRSLVGQLIGVN